MIDFLSAVGQWLTTPLYLGLDAVWWLWGAGAGLGWFILGLVGPTDNSDDTAAFWFAVAFWPVVAGIGAAVFVLWSPVMLGRQCRKLIGEE